MECVPRLLPPSVYSEGMEDGLLASERFWLNVKRWLTKTRPMQKGWGAGRGLRGTWDHAKTLSGAELGPPT